MQKFGAHMVQPFLSQVESQEACKPRSMVLAVERTRKVMTESGLPAFKSCFCHFPDV